MAIPARRQRIACAVERGAGDGEAVRRAAALAGAGGTIELLSVAIVRDGEPRRAEPEQVDDLAGAAVTAALSGVRARPRIVAGRTEADGVLAASAGCDVVVIGPGDTADELVRRAGVTVLVAS